MCPREHLKSSETPRCQKYNILQFIVKLVTNIMSDRECIKCLPHELNAHILSSLDSVQSLPVIRLTCRKIYKAISKEIMWYILRRQIPELLLPYAIAILQCVDFEFGWQVRDIGRALLEMLRGGTGVIAEWVSTITLEVGFALRIGSLHDLVARLADEFAGVCLGRAPGVPVGWDVSEDEELRICRALYRTELFYRVFEKDNEGLKEDVWSENRRAFFEFYTP
jgi:hypothetical protein